MWQSLRMGAASEMVRDQPPPPLCVVSSSEIADTMPTCSICSNGRMLEQWGVRVTCQGDAYDAGEHFGVGVCLQASDNDYGIDLANCLR